MFGSGVGTLMGTIAAFVAALGTIEQTNVLFQVLLKATNAKVVTKSDSVWPGNCKISGPLCRMVEKSDSCHTIPIKHSPRHYAQPRKPTEIFPHNLWYPPLW